jgi:tetratricopeptide (TPR) repeat protein
MNSDSSISEQAIEALRILESKKHFATLFERAKAMRREGHNSAELNLLFAKSLNLLFRTREALPILQSLLNVRPFRFACAKQLGYLFDKTGQGDQALKHFQLAGNYMPMHPLHWVEVGRILLRQGKLEEAQAAFQSALAVEGPHADAHHNLGTCFQIQAKYPEALQQFEAAIHSDPTFKGAERSRQDVSAAISYRQEIKNIPDLEIVDDALLARLYLAAKKFTDQKFYLAASEACKVYLRYDPEAIQFGEIWFLLANALRCIGRLSEAEPLLVRLSTLEGEEVGMKASVSLGVLHEHRFNDDEAERRYKLAAGIMPKSFIPPSKLGKLFLRQGRIMEAKAELNRALEIRGDDDELYYLRGHCYRADEQYDRARKDYEKALALGPEIAERRLALNDVVEMAQPL